jgi:hypothetical protein
MIALQIQKKILAGKRTHCQYKNHVKDRQR